VGKEGVGIKVSKQYRLYNKDCFEVFGKIPDKRIDLVLTDLPYGTIECVWDSVIPLGLMWEQIRRVIRDNGVIALFGVEPFSSRLRLSAINMFKYDWVWVKNRSTGAMSKDEKPLTCVEYIHVFYTGKPVYNPQMIERGKGELKRLSKNSHCVNSEDNGIGFSRIYVQKRESLRFRYPRRVIDIKTVFNRGGEKVAHPTQKPVALMEYLIRTHTNRGGIVLDFAMGSGTTGVACGNLGRLFVGCDIDVEHGYFEIAKRRIQEAYKKVQLGFGL